MSEPFREWKFCYKRKDGAQVNGFFSFSSPKQDAERKCWVVTYRHDWDPAERKLYGEDEQQVLQLIVEFFHKLYVDLAPENKDGTPFDWEKVRQSVKK